MCDNARLSICMSDKGTARDWGSSEITVALQSATPRADRVRSVVEIRIGGSAGTARAGHFRRSSAAATLGYAGSQFAALEFSGKFTSAGIPARAEMVRSYDLEFRLARARKLERALRNKGWTRKQLAEETGYDEKAIRNILAGEPVRDQTVVDVSQAVGIEPETDTKHDRVEVAEDEYGGYSRSTHRQYESFFYSYRRSFTNYGEIFKSIIEIRWDTIDNKFVFFDYYEMDKVTGQDARAHTGAVFMSSFTNLLHLQTIYEGSLRLITLTKMREPEGIMRGAIMTQSENIMSFQPTLSPIVLRRIPTYNVGKELPRDMKMIAADESDYEFAAVQLGLTERQTIKLAFDNLQIQ